MAVSREKRLDVSDFSNKQTRTIKTPCFILKISDNNLNINRFAVIIKSGLEKKSTRRNYIKRFILNTVSNWPPMGMDFLFIVSKKFLGGKKDVRRDIIGSLKQAIDSRRM